MSMFRNLLKNQSSSYIRLIPETLSYLAEEETKILVVESNDKWSLYINDNQE